MLFALIIITIGLIIYLHTINKTTIKSKPKVIAQKIIPKKTLKLAMTGPLGQDIYICDSKNNRIIEVNPQKQII